MKVHLIWAQDKNGGIGCNGKLPWHVSSDLKNFKDLTLNSTIIMGRKTWDSLPKKPLSDRKNIVLSSIKQGKAETFHTYNECLNTLKGNNTDKIYIIGGRSLYKLFFNIADYLHITKIQILESKVNEYFPISMDEIENKFNQTSEKILSDNAIYTFWIKK